jgi:hypothetical protein
MKMIGTSYSTAKEHHTGKLTVCGSFGSLPTLTSTSYVISLLMPAAVRAA